MSSPKKDPKAGSRPQARAVRADTVLVNAANRVDVQRIARAVAALLRELGAEPPPVSEMVKTVNALIDDPELGAVLVATAPTADGNLLVGVLAASWQTAIHVPGRYGLIQDLWVDPQWRSKAVGRRLLRAFDEHARRAGVHQIEVGIPRDSFESVEQTEAFYAANGFLTIGSRMRWKLS